MPANAVTNVDFRSETSDDKNGTAKCQLMHSPMETFVGQRFFNGEFRWRTAVSLVEVPLCIASEGPLCIASDGPLCIASDEYLSKQI